MLARFKDTSILVYLTFRKIYSDERGNIARFEDISILVFLFFRKIRLTNAATQQDSKIFQFSYSFRKIHLATCQQDSKILQFSYVSLFERYVAIQQDSKIHQFSYSFRKIRSNTARFTFKDISILVFFFFRKICMINVAT